MLAVNSDLSISSDSCQVAQFCTWWVFRSLPDPFSVSFKNTIYHVWYCEERILEVLITKLYTFKVVQEDNKKTTLTLLRFSHQPKILCRFEKTTLRSRIKWTYKKLLIIVEWILPRFFASTHRAESKCITLWLICICTWMVENKTWLSFEIKTRKHKEWNHSTKWLRGWARLLHLKLIF